MLENEGLEAGQAGPAQDRLETESEPKFHRFFNFNLTPSLILKARKLEINNSGWEFCKSCLIKFPLHLSSGTIEEHHLIPSRLHNHVDFKNLNSKVGEKTIKICAVCHEIAHIIIKDSEDCKWTIDFWNDESLIKEIRKFRSNFVKKGKY